MDTNNFFLQSARRFATELPRVELVSRSHERKAIPIFSGTLTIKTVYQWHLSKLHEALSVYSVGDRSPDRSWENF